MLFSGAVNNIGKEKNIFHVKWINNRIFLNKKFSNVSINMKGTT